MKAQASGPCVQYAGRQCSFSGHAHACPFCSGGVAVSCSRPPDRVLFYLRRGTSGTWL